MAGIRLRLGVHCQELGIWQYAQGNPQAGAGAAVGKCLTIRPVQVACERATPAMSLSDPSPFALLTLTCTKKVQVPLTLAPILIPERTEDDFRSSEARPQSGHRDSDSDEIPPYY